MGKKILFFILFSYIFIYCDNKNVLSKENTIFDTIFFASKNSAQQNTKAFLVETAIQYKEFIILKSSGKGSSMWIDSVLFEKKGEKAFFNIVSVPMSGYFILSYNGDSLFTKLIAKNYPYIQANNISKEFSEVIIKDSIYNSGYLNRTLSVYFLANNGIILGDTMIIVKQKTNDY